MCAWVIHNDLKQRCVKARLPAVTAGFETVSHFRR
jgi:hypothetical protein